MSAPPIINRTALELYRDCLRLVKHVAPGSSPKSVALRQMVRQSFKASQHLTDEAQIANKKADAVRALSNYLVYQSAQTDERLQAAMTTKPPPASSSPSLSGGNDKEKGTKE